VFVTRLVVKLEMKLDGTVFTVPGGNIKNLSIQLCPYGFSASLDFWFVCLSDQSEDEILAKFIKDELGTVKLTLDSKFDTVGESADPLVLAGVVEQRDFSERVFEDLTGSPILHRHYHLEFADRAQVLWRQHFPTSLYVDKTLTELIDDNKPDGVKLTHAWEAGKAKSPVLSLPLGTEANEASFYDYIHWLLRRHHAGLYYDYDNDAYVISDQKKEFGSSVSLPTDDIAELTAVFSPISRAAVSVLNGCTSASTTEKVVDNKLKVAGVKRQYLLRSSVAKDLVNRAALETKRHAQPQVAAALEFTKYPSTTMRPNLLVKFDEWSDKLFQAKQTYRVRYVEFDAHAQSQEAIDDAEDPSNAYEIQYASRLEKQEDTLFAYPEFRNPVWDMRVEGVVVSEVGEEKQETYQSYRDDNSSIDYYKVEVPLWASQKAIALYEPLFAPGHFYFPIYKGARVLLHLNYDSATIVGFVDWRAGARLPLETQGNHLLLGKKNEDQTSIAHVYKDAKPQLQIVRTHGKDKQTVEVSEGRVYIETIATE
jgi:hypothetical protein